MSSSFFAYLFAGKILIFFGMKFAQDNGITKGFIGRLLSCGLCLGFWIYTLLSLVLGVYIFDDLFTSPILLAIITGASSSFLVYVFSAGWDSLFSTIVIE